MIRQFFSFILALILLSALLSVILPLLLYRWTAPFPGALGFALFFTAIALEKVWSSFARLRQRTDLSVRGDWTSVSVGVSYTLVQYAVLAEFFWKRQGVTWPLLSLVGIGVYGGAVAFRYWAFHHLGLQWAVQLDKAIPDRHLVRAGPYALVRHPLYVAYCLETIGVPLAFNSWWPLLLTAVTFIPLEIQRAFFEERFLRATFGDEYESYAAETGAFLPRLRKNLASRR